MNWDEFVAIWVASEPRPKPIFFRLYYNESGDPVSYSMEDLPGNYIDIDAEAFRLANPNVKVVDGKIVEIVRRRPNAKLQPTEQGTPCHPQDVSVVSTQEPNIKWNKVYEN